MATTPKKYSIDLEDSESESFIPNTLSSAINRRRSFFDKFALGGWVLALILLGGNTYRYICPKAPTDLECTKQLTAWSPTYPMVEYESVQFSNSFYQPSPYKGRPNPELEKAWSDLWKIGTIDVPLEHLPALNKSTEHAWMMSDKGGVLAGLEVFHSMHCLDMVRQYTWRGEYDYSDNPTFQDDDEFLRVHVDHCIEALRIRLMCYADVTPFLHEISDSEMGATPDFNTQHRCKKYDKIQEWQRTHHARAAKGPAEGGHGGHGH